MTNGTLPVLTDTDLTERAAAIMTRHVALAAEHDNLQPVLDGIRQLLIEMGVRIRRIQIPMTKLGGLRHPIYWGIILTWSARTGFEKTLRITHEQREQQGLQSTAAANASGKHGDSVPRHSPYYDLLQSGNASLRIDLTRDALRHDLLRTMRDEGMVDYLALALPVPGFPLPQLMSFAADAPFPSDFETRFARVQNIVALGLYGACQASQATAVARTYLGPRTGQRVLYGDIARGFSQEIRAGIMFCDIRGFTALSQKLGGASIVPLMNTLFEAIGHSATLRGGEILKFIGDAMLIIFRLETRDEADIARAMVDTTQDAIEKVAALATAHGERVEVGFGSHVGQVVYGNIGTPDRLDFTVMGPAVNLTSRLEGLTKEVDCSAVFSAAIAEHVPSLTHRGDFSVKGLPHPVPVYIDPLQNKEPSGR